MRRELSKIALRIGSRLSQKTFYRYKDEVIQSFAERQGLSPISPYNANDVFIVGWPKSGNTWMQRIITSLKFGISGPLLNDHICQLLVPDVHLRSHHHRYSPECFFKSHQLPQANMKKVIHIVRDGRDALVSYWYMLQKMNKTVDFEEMVLSGASCVPCDWVTHCEKWLQNPYSSNIHLMRYEDLLNSPEFEMQKICEFLQIDRSSAEIDQCVEDTSFRAMKKIETDSGWANKAWPEDKAFLREGKSGKHQELLNGSLLGKFELKASSIMSDLGYK